MDSLRCFCVANLLRRSPPSQYLNFIVIQQIVTQLLINNSSRLDNIQRISQHLGGPIRRFIIRKILLVSEVFLFLLKTALNLYIDS